MERVERIENLNVCSFRAQGIVSADGTILMSTASCLPADCLWTGLAGLRAARSSFCRCAS